LSINASIEAVKAGNAGKGFAVVANSIRELSQQSRQATEQVRKTLTEIQGAIAQIVIVNEKGLGAAKQGVKSMDHTGTLMASLVKSIVLSSQAAREIAQNTLQQSIGLEQTTSAMTDINKGTLDNLKVIETLSDRGAELKKHSESLQNLVEQFRIK
jgi:methyl-accepting chemotaxis protein